MEHIAIGQLFALAEQYKAAGHKAASVELYKSWIAYHPDDPFLYAAYFNYGTTLNDLKDRFGAINAFRDSARLKPDFYQAHLSLGLTLEQIGRKGEAITEWLGVASALALVNGETVAHRIYALEQIGRVLESLDRDGPAEDALRQRLELGTDDKVIQHWIALRMRQCKWPVLTETDRMKRRSLLSGISPLSLAAFADDPMFQLATAYRYNKALIGAQKGARRWAVPGMSSPDRKLRIGYVSSDLREHAVGFSMADVLALHDRDRFEIYAYYCGIENDDSTKLRIKASVDQWFDIDALSDEQVCLQIEADAIDILIDLNGYTKGARTRVFALRPAPIAVNWFGYPCTMGSPYHHYIIADAQVVPPDAERFYSETVVRLPCYQPNDRNRVVSSRKPTRAEEGLPETGFVFCCLNGLQKLTEITFGRWMIILAAVPDSVLWLLGGTPDTQERLRGLAAGAGIAPERLVFAGKIANPDHLARYALADLFLDNLPYGAHTTAADALWMGLPVLTVAGRSFASRVCSSLVSAAGLGDLICPNPDIYMARAIALGRTPDAIQTLKARLAAQRDSCLLFDTPRLVAHLEDLYRQMWSAFERGALPSPELANLDTYHAIGTSLDIESVELLSDEAYRALYAEKLADWDATYPIRPDTRLWPGPNESGVSDLQSIFHKGRRLL
ncbi:glycosyl transferase [Beijerinckia sp. L45]|uniref:O-linked N-acetylglucosamine transferase, SPINDLY family protein n=1 Tax=Beijerinckia sp. L45 TaxID=1641855 RepID=UPI001FF01FA0|nr:glycosyl transferase [Beijerinckia sp. L45]